MLIFFKKNTKNSKKMTIIYEKCHFFYIFFEKKRFFGIKNLFLMIFLSKLQI